jgi:hypothetical protein
MYFFTASCVIAPKDDHSTMGDQKMQGSLKMSCESVSSGWGTLCTVWRFKSTSRR